MTNAAGKTANAQAVDVVVKEHARDVLKPALWVH